MSTALMVAVPMWIDRIKREAWTFERRAERAAICGQHVAEKGDVLQFGGKKGEAAEAFNRLAEGLACAAFQPGGVRFAGVLYDANPPSIDKPASKVPPPPPKRKRRSEL